MIRLLTWLCLIFLILIGMPTAANAGFFNQADMDAFLSRNPNVVAGRAATLKSNMYDLSVEWIELPEWQATGGAVEFQDGILIIISPQGALSWINLDKRQGPFPTFIAAPMNVAELMASETVKQAKVNVAWFRAADLYIEPIADGLRLFVSHHVFEEGCFFFQLSSVDVGFDAEVGIKQLSKWKSLFRPQPCVHIGDASNRPFAGMQAGGKIVSIDGGHLLVAYGDHEMDGDRGENHPQNPESPYGKIWKVAKDGSSATLYAMGVRNPQGMFVDNKGRIWESEQGPQGGDELNLLSQGVNYGWPFETYGVWYGDHIWRLNPVQGNHADNRYRSPAFAWVPSIAITSITQITGPKFELWQDDLLVTTLKDQSFRRLRLVGDKVVYDEPIEIGKRIRDLIALPDGRLVLLGDSPMIGIVDTVGTKLTPRDIKDGDEPAAPGAVANANEGAALGEALFNKSCASCHSLTTNGIGPALGDLTARVIGKAPGFHYASDALAKSTEAWTSSTFSAFVRNPSAMFPGSAMAPIDIAPPDVLQIFEYLTKLDQTAQIAAKTTSRAALSSIEDTISVLLREREWLMTLAEQPPGEAFDYMVGKVLAPFVVPFALGERRPVAAYEELSPGFWIGYDAAAKSSVLVSQTAKSDSSLSPANHRYTMKVEVQDPGSSEWVTVEKKINQIRGNSKYRIVVALKARFDKTAALDMDLFIPKRSGKPERIKLGTVDLSNNFRSIFFSKEIDIASIPDIDFAAEPKIVIFLPIRAGASIEFASLDVYFYPD